MMKIHEAQPPLFYTFTNWEKEPGLIHGFSTRYGGDDLAALGAAIGFDIERAVLSQQTHTVNIYEAGESDAGRGINKPLGYTDIDGLLTETKNLPLLTFHADCVPLFFYAAARGMVGLAHAGWRGTAGNIAAKMVKAMLERGCKPQDIKAAIGPCAGPCCYQVGPEVATLFAPHTYTEDSDCPGKFKLNLWQANRDMLLKAGLKAENIITGGLCTVCNHDIFYSHRVHGENRGTMAAVIMLTRGGENDYR